MSESSRERQRRYRERKLLRRIQTLRSKDTNTVTPPTDLDVMLSYYQEKGLWLCRAFIKAWADTFTSAKWRAKYKYSHFQHFDRPGKDQPEPDFVIIAQTYSGEIFRLAVIELKNWFTPQWLDAKSTERKITKKFGKTFGPEWIKLLVLTPAVNFQDDAKDLLVQGNFKIERVDELPGSHPNGAGTYLRDTVEETEYRVYEARSIEQMKRIL